MELEALTEALARLLARGEEGALATVVASSGSTPRQPGARLLLTASGEQLGTVGGGRVEHEVLRALRACLQQGQARLVRWDLARDLGMCCGGRMQVFVEPILPAPRLLIFGAGHVGAATATAARHAGFRVTVADAREELNTAARLPDCARALLDPDEALREFRPSERDWLLIATHDHQLDCETLATCLGAPHRYVGMVGSERKVLRALARLRDRYGDGLDTSRLYAPVGLDLGAETPAEIAVSVVAELVALRRGAQARHLRRLTPTPATRGLTAAPREEETGT